MKKSLSFSKLDNILRLMIFLHEKANLKTMTLNLLKAFSYPVDIANQQKILLRRVAIKFILRFLGYILIVPLLAIFYTVYFIVATITSCVASIVIISLALVYGLFPFLIKGIDIQRTDKTTNRIFKGHNILLKPIIWSGKTTNKNSAKFIDLARMPLIKIEQLKADQSETHIVEQIALTTACIFSFTLYVGLTFMTIQLVSYTIWLIISLTLFIIWLSITGFMVLFTNKTLNDTDIKEENSENELEAKNND